MNISIIGLGWLGLPLAKHLILQGHQVIGSTTSSEKLTSLREANLEVRLLNLTPHPTGQRFSSLFHTDLLIINIPPGTRTKPDTFHPEQVKYLKALAEQHGIKKIIYISSTSIYPSGEGEYKEDFDLTDQNTGNLVLWKAENLLVKDAGYDLTILRCGGLMGEKRIPGKYFSGKENVDGDFPVNYIHQQDVIGIIDWVISKNMWNRTFNAVSPMHPLRRDVYLKSAETAGFAPPLSYSQNQQKRIISSEKIIAQGYKFSYPDPLEYAYSTE